MSKTTYICQLPKECQNRITQLLTESGVNQLQIALDGRLCDLEDTINIEEVWACFG